MPWWVLFCHHSISLDAVITMDNRMSTSTETIQVEKLRDAMSLSPLCLNFPIPCELTSIVVILEFIYVLIYAKSLYLLDGIAVSLIYINVILHDCASLL